VGSGDEINSHGGTGTNWNKRSGNEGLWRENICYLFRFHHENTKKPYSLAKIK